MFTARANEQRRSHQLLSAIVNPSRSGGVRLPTPGVPTLTSTMALQSTLDVATVTNSTSTRFLLTDDPALPLWVDTASRWMMAASFGLVMNRAPVANTEEDINFESIVPFTLPYVAGPVTFSSASSIPVWPVNFAGVHNGKEYIYVPGGATAYFYLIYYTPGASPAGYITFSVFDAVADTTFTANATNVSTSTAVVEYTPVSPVWIRPVSFSSTVTHTVSGVTLAVVVSSAPLFATFASNTITVAPTAVPPVTALMPATKPDIIDSRPVMQSVRTVSVRLDISNYTKQLNVEGMIHLGRTSPTMDRWNWTQTDITSRHPRLRYSSKAAVDTSMVLLPSGSSPNFRDALARVPRFDLDSTNPCIIGSLFDGNPQDQSSFSFRTSWQVEFMNTTQLWQVGFTPYTVRDLEDVARTIAMTGFAGPTTSFFRTIKAARPPRAKKPRKPRPAPNPKASPQRTRVVRRPLLTG